LQIGGSTETSAGPKGVGFEPKASDCRDAYLRESKQRRTPKMPEKILSPRSEGVDLVKKEKGLKRAEKRGLRGKGMLSKKKNELLRKVPPSIKGRAHVPGKQEDRKDPGARGREKIGMGSWGGAKFAKKGQTLW